MDTKLSLFVAFGAGLFSFVSPCILPLVPSYVLYVTGVSFRDFSEQVHSLRLREKILFNSLFFVLGFSVIFIFLGAVATLFGRLVFAYRDWIRVIGGIIIILLGLEITGLFHLRFLDLEKRFNLKIKPRGYLGSFLVGVTFGTAWVPCVGPILGTILLMAGTSDTVNQGILLLTFYSLGLGIPFLLTSLLLNYAFVYFRRLTKYMGQVKLVSGVFMILIGTLILTNYFQAFMVRFINWTGFGGI